MLKAKRNRWRELAVGTRGAEIAEAAMVLPLTFIFLLAIFWFGQAYRTYGALTHAARAGARAATAPACATCTTPSTTPGQRALSAVQSALQVANLDPANLQQPTPLPALCACGSPTITSCSGSVVTCDSTQGTICVQGSQNTTLQPVALSDKSVGAGSCGISVSFQYPYQFTLPFTSLNMQTVNLRAQAQMRVETQ